MIGLQAEGGGAGMRLWPDYIRSRRSSITVLLLCTIFTILVTGTYATRPPKPVQTPGHIASQEQAIVLREQEYYRILLLYEPKDQHFRCALSLPGDPSPILYSPSVRFTLVPGHPLTIRYPSVSQAQAFADRTGQDIPDIKNTLPTIEVCITPRALTTSQSSQYTSETFLKDWHIRWKIMEQDFGRY